MTSPLAGIRAVVTGSTRGLGLAFARELVRGGASVVVNGRTAAACDAALATLGAGDQVAAVPGSVADEAVADGLVSTCVERFGGVDFVVNNAGVVRDASLAKMRAEDFDEVVAVHLRGAWAVSRAAARAMRGHGGAILNVVSGTALYGFPGQSNYAAAKGGMLAMTRALSLELRRHDIRVNALAPIAMTEMTAGLAGNGALAAHFGAPDDVAPIVAFLASPAAAHISGQVLTFNGRELVIWSHPAPVADAARDGRWEAADFAAELGGESSPLQAVNPDALGRAAHHALGLA